MAKKKSRAQRNIEWIEKYLPHSRGRQCRQAAEDGAVHARRFQGDLRQSDTAPAGRSSRAAARTPRRGMRAILLLHLCGPEARPNAQLFSAAQSRDQAAVLFDLAAKMVRLNPVLSAVVVIRETAKELLLPRLGTIYRALSAEASDRLRPLAGLMVHDELGQVKGPRSALYEAMETATAAQDEPLTVVISTQAPTDADLLSMLIDDALDRADPRVVSGSNTAPVDVDPFSLRRSSPANPAFDIFMNRAEVLAMAEDARRLPARQPNSAI